MNILLIEDDDVLADGLTHTLSDSGYCVTVAKTGTYAEHLLKAEGFDLIVLDLGLPDMDGLQLLRKLRSQKLSLPIMILTARDDLNDRIEGISQGADDYMTKPFELRELEARLHALIRRCYGGFSHIIEVGSLQLDTSSQKILAKGELLSLSAREYAVLELLLMQNGKVISKDKFAQHLSLQGDALTDNAIEVYIHRIRKHIAPYDVGIRTFRGLGYLLENKLND
ncbi:MAG: response regulator transcription factor [Methylococcaceae bacterium]|nr:response regulator transcription factor [Methylococcaceae bacterium]